MRAGGQNFGVKTRPQIFLAQNLIFFNSFPISEKSEKIFFNGFLLTNYLYLEQFVPLTNCHSPHSLASVKDMFV
jgi:hypothetical protein